eukprot:scaffold2764_cov399-Prasinococcus_capsulatus_cf.AAC.14
MSGLHRGCLSATLDMETRPGLVHPTPRRCSVRRRVRVVVPVCEARARLLIPMREMGPLITRRQPER